MKCFECGGEVVQTVGSVRMTKQDGTLIIFKGIPLSQCRQCGEQ
ncbi:MAG: YgiT-type zinc finger protein, partial [Deltaproteobacteria bacterium]|nr:YgiT-type zinc finger protein [Deltaproteobacteria bacterium]